LIIDADYRGTVIVSLHNHGTETQIVEPGDRIAQLIAMPYYPIQFNEVDELNATKRGDGGFGSTGSN
jgi:dUTP pyrophosphatase